MRNRRRRIYRGVSKTSDRRKPKRSGDCAPHQHKTLEMARRSAQFRKMGCGYWYIIHNQLHNWSTGGRKGGNSTHNRLRNTFISGQVELIPECTPRPPSRVHEGGRENDQELMEYSLFAQYVVRIEQMLREPQEGYTEYIPLMRLDFDKLSRRRQVLELQRTGLLVDNSTSNQTRKHTPQHTSKQTSGDITTISTDCRPTLPSI